jgi:hypothetical protein
MLTIPRRLQLEKAKMVRSATARLGSAFCWGPQSGLDWIRKKQAHTSMGASSWNVVRFDDDRKGFPLTCLGSLMARFFNFISLSFSLLNPSLLALLTCPFSASSLLLFFPYSLARLALYTLSKRLHS